MAKFKYRATSNGTLSNPFRYVRAGELVVSEVAIKASWLTPEKEYEEPKDLPITSVSDLQMTKDLHRPNDLPPVAENSSYAASMEDIKALEARQDGVAAPAPPEAPAAPVEPQVNAAPAPAPAEAPVAPTTVVNEEAAQTGTGDQDVI